MTQSPFGRHVVLALYRCTIRITTLMPALVAMVFFAYPSLGSDGDERKSRACEAAIDRAAGSYGKCLLKAQARAAKRGNPGKLDAQSKACRAAFDSRASRALARYGEEQCTPLHLVDAIDSRSISFAESVALDAAGIPDVDLLFVQSSLGGQITGSELRLSRVDETTAWFTQPPFRSAGHGTTHEFVEKWDGNSLRQLNHADFACYVDGQSVNLLVTLRNPAFDGEDLVYQAVFAEASDEDLPLEPVVCDGDAHLFIAGAAVHAQWGAVEDRYFHGRCARARFSIQSSND